MAGMLPEDELYGYWRAREALPRNDPRQALLGPLEHRQFVRETVQNNPLMAIPLAAAIPFYTAGKALGLTNARSPASWDEIFAGYGGLADGMLPYLVPSAEATERVNSQQLPQPAPRPPRPEPRPGMIPGVNGTKYPIPADPDWPRLPWPSAGGVRG